MAVNGCDLDVFSASETSLDFVNSKCEKGQHCMAQQNSRSSLDAAAAAAEGDNHSEHSEDGHSSELSCVMCAAAVSLTTSTTATNSAQRLVVLPCLHVTCRSCLIQFLQLNALPHRDCDDNFAESILTCPRCSYMIQLSRDGVDGLREAPFLQLVTSSAAVNSDTDNEGGENTIRTGFNGPHKQLQPSSTAVSGISCESQDDMRLLHPALRISSSSRPNNDSQIQGDVGSNLLTMSTHIVKHCHVASTNTDNDISCATKYNIEWFGDAEGNLGSTEIDMVGCKRENVNASPSVAALLEMKRSEDVDYLLDCQQTSDRIAKVTLASSLNNRQTDTNTSNSHGPRALDVSASGALHNHMNEVLPVSAANDKILFSSPTDDSDLKSSDDIVEGSKSEVRRLMRSVLSRRVWCREATEQTELATSELDMRRVAVQTSIEKRADDLCRLIHQRRDHLVAELDREHAQSSSKYQETQASVDAYNRNLDDCGQFVGVALSSAGDVSNGLLTDVMARLNQLLLADQVSLPGLMPQLTSLRLSVPDARNVDPHVDRLFGSLVKGTIGTVQSLTSFNTELQWPTSFVVTHDHESVLAGKAGAFADHGEVHFYDSHGFRANSHAMPTGHLPVDMVNTRSGHVLVSDLGGRITKFSACGEVVAEWTDMFDAVGGHMSVNNTGQLLVTSSGHVHSYNPVTGQRIATFALHWPQNDAASTTLQIGAVTVNSRDEIIVVDASKYGLHFFTSDGRFVRTTDSPSGNGAKGMPSAICCDPFDNVLVADFLGNCVYMVTQAGNCVGRLVTEAHGVACPICVALDDDGRLYVGQYGGDVLVFCYLSCVQRV